MERSPRFGSNISNIIPLPIYFYYIGTVAFARAFNLATNINLLTHYAKGTSSFNIIYFKFRLLIELLIQDLFTSHLLSFQLSFTVLFTIAKFIILSP